MSGMAELQINAAHRVIENCRAERKRTGAAWPRPMMVHPGIIVPVRNDIEFRAWKRRDRIFEMAISGVAGIALIMAVVLTAVL